MTEFHRRGIHRLDLDPVVEHFARPHYVNLTAFTEEGALVAHPYEIAEKPILPHALVGLGGLELLFLASPGGLELLLPASQFTRARGWRGGPDRGGRRRGYRRGTGARPGGLLDAYGERREDVLRFLEHDLLGTGRLRLDQSRQPAGAARSLA